MGPEGLGKLNRLLALTLCLLFPHALHADEPLVPAAETETAAQIAEAIESKLGQPVIYVTIGRSPGLVAAMLAARYPGKVFNIPFSEGSKAFVFLQRLAQRQPHQISPANLEKAYRLKHHFEKFLPEPSVVQDHRICVIDWTHSGDTLGLGTYFTQQFYQEGFAIRKQPPPEIRALSLKEENTSFYVDVPDLSDRTKTQRIKIEPLGPVAAKIDDSFLFLSKSFAEFSRYDVFDEKAVAVPNSKYALAVAQFKAAIPSSQARAERSWLASKCKTFFPLLLRTTDAQ